MIGIEHPDIGHIENTGYGADDPRDPDYRNKWLEEPEDEIEDDSVEGQND